MRESNRTISLFEAVMLMNGAAIGIMAFIMMTLYRPVIFQLGFPLG